jgi:AcrR family transcriptional regulator
MARPRKVERSSVLAAALALVDAEGLSALTMRRLGEALGVEAMSLYRHVANKEAVLDGVHEAVLASVEWPAITGRWRDDVRTAAWAFRRALREHPNALPLLATRPANTAASLEHLEQALARLATPFPDPRRRVQAVQSLLALVIGHAMIHDAPVGTGPDYEALDAEAFPMLACVAPVLSDYDPDAELDFALDCLMAGWAKRRRS